MALVCEILLCFVESNEGLPIAAFMFLKLAEGKINFVVRLRRGEEGQRVCPTALRYRFQFLIVKATMCFHVQRFLHWFERFIPLYNCFHYGS